MLKVNSKSRQLLGQFYPGIFFYYYYFVDLLLFFFLFFFFVWSSWLTRELQEWCTETSLSFNQNIFLVKQTYMLIVGIFSMTSITCWYTFRTILPARAGVCWLALVGSLLKMPPILNKPGVWIWHVCICKGYAKFWICLIMLQ